MSITVQHRPLRSYAAHTYGIIIIIKHLGSNIAQQRIQYPILLFCTFFPSVFIYLFFSLSFWFFLVIVVVAVAVDPKQLTWIDGSGNVQTKGIKNEKVPLPDGKRFTAKSTLKMKPLKKHNNMTFTCQAKNAANKNAKTAEIKLEVSFCLSI